MPKLGEVVSSVIMTAIGVAVIFRVDMLRGLVTGIQTSATGAAPATGKVLYI